MKKLIDRKYVLRQSKNIINITASATLIASLTFMGVSDKSLALETDYIISSMQNQESSEILNHCIELNINLSQKEKEILKRIIPFVEDYKDVIDFSKVIYRLKQVEIIYSDKKMNVAANYFSITNKIIVYGTPETLNEKVLLHEIFHCIHFTINPNLFEEGITEILSAEYSSDENTRHDSYFGHVNISKLFCELVGTDVMINAYLNNDIEIIRNELLKIDSSTEKADKLMGLVDKFFKLYRKEADEHQQYIVFEKIKQLLNDYFVISYGDNFDLLLLEVAIVNHKYFKKVENIITQKNIT